MQLSGVPSVEATEVLTAAGTVVNANAQSTAKDGYRDADAVIIEIVVSAATGTNPTLDVALQDMPDGANWVTVQSFAQITVAGTYALRVTAPLSGKVRLSYVTGGTTPSFTLGATAYAKAKVVR